MENFGLSTQSSTLDVLRSPNMAPLTLHQDLEPINWEFGLLFGQYHNIWMVFMVMALGPSVMWPLPYELSTNQPLGS